MKYKVGDKVKVRDDLETFRMYGKYEFEEEMEIHKGKEATIIGVYKDNYDLNIDNDGFYWTDEMLKPIAKSIAESIAESDENTDKVSTNSVESIDNFSFKDLKFGDIVTLRNGEQGITSGEKIVYPNEKFDFTKEFDTEFNYLGNNEEFDIIKVERFKRVIGAYYEIETLYERKEILDKEEKEYLSAVIKPFRDKIEYISKIKSPKGIFIYIRFKSDGDMNFPYLKSDELYKEMELNKTYKLEELGI